MKFKTINHYQTDENAYLIYDEHTKNGLVLDPGYKADGIIKCAEDEGVKIQYVFLTHCHYDHIDSAQELLDKTGAKLVCTNRCAVNVSDPDINLSLYGLGRTISLQADIRLSDGEVFQMDSVAVLCMETPGHTGCSTCYLIENHLFSGDTLFLRGIGRCDLPTGNEQQLIDSIKNRLYTLAENTEVHPGHGDSSSIGYEKKYNLFIKA